MPGPTYDTGHCGGVGGGRGGGAQPALPGRPLLAGCNSLLPQGGGGGEGEQEVGGGGELAGAGGAVLELDGGGLAAENLEAVGDHLLGSLVLPLLPVEKNTEGTLWPI